MKHAVAVLFLAVGLVASAGLAGAQTAVKSSSSLIDRMPARRAAPQRLSAKKVLTLVNSRLKAAGLKAVGSAPQTLEMRVTPAAPKGATGGAVTFMGPGVWQAPDSKAPDGSFLAQAAAVRMEFPTTPNKLHVLDCRLEMIQNASVAVERAGAADASPPIEDGHLIHAFTAVESTTKLTLRFRTPPGFPAAGYFYGCDFGAVN